MKQLGLAIFLIFITVFSIADGDQNIIKIDENITERIDLLENRLLEVRRDQLNYSIEKDLLKNTYSSNLETLNVVITIVLGMISIFAFFGIRSIADIKSDFKEELRQFRELRTSSEYRLLEIEDQLTQAKDHLSEMTKLNATQDVRLKVLELIERVGSLMENNQRKHALQYIAVGLDMDENNIRLLEQKQSCLIKLRRFEEAMDVQELVLSLDHQNRSCATNLCELCLLHGRRDRYSELREEFATEISKETYLNWFFDSYELYLDADDDVLKNKIETLVKTLPAGKNQNDGWSYAEAIYTINTHENRTITPELLRVLMYFDKTIESTDILP